jgi:8-oxo-dGTP pyrophosphatase MutT (NUDIX family)
MSLPADWRTQVSRTAAWPDREESAARPRAAVAIAVSPRHEILLMRRAEHPDDPWSGQVSLPGGRVDPGDATSEAAARRETLEELGVDLGRDATLVGGLEPLAATARGATLDLQVHPWVYQLERDVELATNEEVDEGFWLPLGALLAGDLAHEHVIERAGLVHRRPAWRVGRHVVWGLTHVILTRFLERVRHGRG